MKKRCIFHIPNHIDKNNKSGSSVRPQMMIKAFEDIGYQVDYVMGYGEERKKAIKQIEQNIINGVKYEFLYAENCTMPTLLTEANHLPRYPFLDFGFFHFCKKYDIKIGLFYRDVYWKFPIYKKEVSFIKRLVTIPMFQYDLVKYKNLVDILYLPSNRMKNYVDVPIPYKELPPGCNEVSANEEGEYKSSNADRLNLFYVGGIGELYDLTKLFQTVDKLEFINLVVCCRESEWKEQKERYMPYINSRIEIIHKSGNELDEHYADADICMLFFESEEYRSFAMPIKLFEYLGKLKPVIATSNTAAGEFVEKNNIGWSVCHEVEELEKLLRKLQCNKNLINRTKENINETLKENTWKSRAYEVEKDLSNIK